MTIRKRRQPTPGFNLPPPYNPVTGHYADLGKKGPVPVVAMMQVVEADTHPNYLVCRGFDPETKRFYGTEDPENPGEYLSTINVAKPYRMRSTYPYEVGQVICCAKPQTQLGTNPGRADETRGHPEDLDEEIVLLYDDAEESPIEWLEVGGVPLRRISVNCYSGAVPPYGVVRASRGLAPWPTEHAPDGKNVQPYSLIAYYVTSIARWPYLVLDGDGATLVGEAYIGFGYWARDYRHALFSHDGVRAMYDVVQASPQAFSWGPAVGSFKLYPGLPGFRILSVPSWSTESESDAYWVDQDPLVSYVRHDDCDLVYWAKATGNWNAATATRPPYVDAHAAVGYEMPVYDGADPGLGGGWSLRDAWPHIDLEIDLPVGPHQDPNVQTGQWLPYRFCPGIDTDAPLAMPLVGAGSYADDKINTVKMWIGDVGDIPQGWEQTGSAEEYARNYSTSGSGTFGTTGTDYSYRNYIFIIRVA